VDTDLLLLLLLLLLLQLLRIVNKGPRNSILHRVSPLIDTRSGRKPYGRMNAALTVLSGYLLTTKHRNGKV
jgi:hypothetical protein